MPTQRSDSLRYLWLLGLVTAVGILVYMLSGILTPFLLAAILAYICNPFVIRMQRYRIPRTLGTVVAMTVLFGLCVLLVLILVPLFQKQLVLLVLRMPGYFDWMKNTVAPWVQSHFGITLHFDAAYFTALLSDNSQFFARFLPSLQTGGMALIGFLISLVLLPVVMFYFLRDWNGLLLSIEEMIPRRWHAQVMRLAHDIDKVLAEFLRGQVAVMLIMSVFYIAALALNGLDYALPVGLIAGMLVFIPYLGMILALFLATLVGFLQYQSIGGVIPVWICFAIGQAIEGMAVTPLLVGKRIGLHPVAVIFALLAFGQIFGFFGVLLALPASAALLVWLRHLRGKYVASSLYQDE